MEWLTWWVQPLIYIFLAIYSYNSGYKAGAQRVLDIWKMQIRGDKEHE